MLTDPNQCRDLLPSAQAPTVLDYGTLVRSTPATSAECTKMKNFHVFRSLLKCTQRHVCAYSVYVHCGHCGHVSTHFAYIADIADICVFAYLRTLLTLQTFAYTVCGHTHISRCTILAYIAYMCAHSLRTLRTFAYTLCVHCVHCVHVLRTRFAYIAYMTWRTIQRTPKNVKIFHFRGHKEGQGARNRHLLPILILCILTRLLACLQVLRQREFCTGMY